MIQIDIVQILMCEGMELLNLNHIFLFSVFRGRKMNASLEKAIQEAMIELDRMSEVE